MTWTFWVGVLVGVPVGGVGLFLWLWLDMKQMEAECELRRMGADD